MFSIVSFTVKPALFDEAATHSGIAVAHSAFNIMCTLLLLPMSSLLEKIVYKLVPETKQPDEIEELDERLLAAPALALERCHALTAEMGRCSMQALKNSIVCLKGYTPELMKDIKSLEDKTDHYEDIISTYLVKLSTRQLERKDSMESAKLLKIIGDFERIADHSVNLAGTGKEISEKELTLSAEASAELDILCNAVDEIITLAYTAFAENNISAAMNVEPLEQIIDRLKEFMRNNHIVRLQRGGCSIEGGFVWSDLLTDLERTSDHCSNIAVSVIDHADMDAHRSLRELKSDNSEFKEKYAVYAKKYLTFDKL